MAEEVFKFALIGSDMDVGINSFTGEDSLLMTRHTQNSKTRL